MRWIERSSRLTISSKTKSRFLTSVREFRIALGKPVEDVLLGFAVDEAHDVRERLHAAGFRKVRAADEQAASEQFVELFQHFRCRLLQNRDAHRDFGLQFGRQRREHRAGLIRRHVHENQRDRLRMFVLNELQQLRRLGLLDQLERIAVLERGEQPVRHVVGLARAERTLQNLLGVLDAAFVDVLEGDRALIRFGDDRVALLERNGRDLRDLQNDALDFVLTQELEDRRREFEAQRDDQDRGLFRTGDVDRRKFCDAPNVEP